MSKKINKILVTGSSGTIGTRLCEKFLENGFEVVGVDYRPNEWSEKIQSITIDIDLRNKDDVINKLPKDFDVVIHLAANARVYNLVVDTSLARDNFDTIYNVLEFTRINKIKKFMFSSSREVYGNSQKILYREDESYVFNCESPYTASKIAGEALVHSYQQCYGINFVIFRFSNVYGMYDNSDRVIPLFYKLCENGRNLIVFGEEKLLDFTYIEDAITGILQCIKKFDKAQNEVFNIAYGQGTTILELAQLFKELLQTNNKITIKDNRPGEVVKYIADISKATEKIGYEPQTPIIEGLKKTINWYKSHYEK